jgi:hypothetical protein
MLPSPGASAAYLPASAASTFEKLFPPSSSVFSVRSACVLSFPSASVLLLVAPVRAAPTFLAVSGFRATTPPPLSMPSLTGTPLIRADAIGLPFSSSMGMTIAPRQSVHSRSANGTRNRFRRARRTFATEVSYLRETAAECSGRDAECPLLAGKPPPIEHAVSPIHGVTAATLWCHAYMLPSGHPYQRRKRRLTSCPARSATPCSATTAMLATSDIRGPISAHRGMVQRPSSCGTQRAGHAYGWRLPRMELQLWRSWMRTDASRSR